jgi:hypothetical protein
MCNRINSENSASTNGLHPGILQNHLKGYCNSYKTTSRYSTSISQGTDNTATMYSPMYLDDPLIKMKLEVERKLATIKRPLIRKGNVCRAVNMFTHVCLFISFSRSNFIFHAFLSALYPFLWIAAIVIEHLANQNRRKSFKGTVSRDFSCPVFFIKHFLLVPIGMPRTDFEFFWIFVELFVFVIDSPAMNTPGSRIESFRFGSFCKHKSHVPRESK